MHAKSRVQSQQKKEDIILKLAICNAKIRSLYYCNKEKVECELEKRHNINGLEPILSK